MNRKNITLVIIGIIFFSCQNTVNEYYENGTTLKTYRLKDSKFHGEYLEYYENGNLKLVHQYENGKLIDSSIYYTEKEKIDKIIYYLKKDSNYVKMFENGRLSSEGKLFKNNKVDKWKYFDKDEKLEKIFEYVNICDTAYTNQGWYFDKNGDTLKKNSNFIKLSNFKEKIKPMEVLNFKMLYKSLLEGDSKSFICVSSKIEENFCNINEVKLDTIYPQNNSFDILVRFSKKGNRNLRGFITEFRIRDYIDKESANFEERKVYFDIPITVE